MGIRSFSSNPLHRSRRSTCLRCEPTLTLMQFACCHCEGYCGVRSCGVEALTCVHARVVKGRTCIIICPLFLFCETCCRYTYQHTHSGTFHDNSACRDKRVFCSICVQSRSVCREARFPQHICTAHPLRYFS